MVIPKIISSPQSIPLNTPFIYINFVRDDIYSEQNKIINAKTNAIAKCTGFVAKYSIIFSI